MWWLSVHRFEAESATLFRKGPSLQGVTPPVSKWVIHRYQQKSLQSLLGEAVLFDSIFVDTDAESR